MLRCLCLLFWLFFFFFKQKTAYEMRISDWSSDVCSSDLLHRRRHPDLGRVVRGARPRTSVVAVRLPLARPHPPGRRADERLRRRRVRRSEEHTSELQSLMRISYAVFCLKKNNDARHILMFVCCEIQRYLILYSRRW